MRIDVCEERRIAQNVAQPLEEGEIDDCRKGDAAPQSAVVAEQHMVTEGKEHARKIHDQRTACKGEHHREQDAGKDGHCARGIDIASDLGKRDLVVGGDDDRRDGQSRPQQAEDQRDGGRGRQAHRVVDIQQDDVRQHDREVEDHHVAEGKACGIEHAAAGHLHHTARRDGADNDAQRCDGHDYAHGGGLGADGRIEEVCGVVHHADKESRHGEDRHHDQHKGIYGFHAVFRANSGTKVRHCGTSNNFATYS